MDPEILATLRIAMRACGLGVATPNQQKLIYGLLKAIYEGTINGSD